MNRPVDNVMIPSRSAEYLHAPTLTYAPGTTPATAVNFYNTFCLNTSLFLQRLRQRRLDLAGGTPSYPDCQGASMHERTGGVRTVVTVMSYLIHP